MVAVVNRRSGLGWDECRLGCCKAKINANSKSKGKLFLHYAREHRRRKNSAEKCVHAKVKALDEQYSVYSVAAVTRTRVIMVISPVIQSCRKGGGVQIKGYLYSIPTHSYNRQEINCQDEPAVLAQSASWHVLPDN